MSRIVIAIEMLSGLGIGLGFGMFVPFGDGAFLGGVCPEVPLHLRRGGHLGLFKVWPLRGRANQTNCDMKWEKRPTHLKSAVLYAIRQQKTSGPFGAATHLKSAVLYAIRQQKTSGPSGTTRHIARRIVISGSGWCTVAFGAGWCIVVSRAGWRTVTFGAAWCIIARRFARHG